MSTKLAWVVPASAIALAVACSSTAPGGGVSEGAALSGPAGFSLHVRAGTSSSEAPYVDSHGVAWTPDADCDVGSSAANTDPIAHTADPTLFHAERWASATQYPEGFTYSIPGVPAGGYSVSLLFSETSGGPVRAAGERQFDVLIDGNKVLSAFDIYAEAGFDSALIKTFNIQSSGSRIQIQFVPGTVQNPKVNAISVEPSVPGPPPGYAIDASFFGLHLNHWPAVVPFGTQRLWDAGVAWPVLNPSKGSFDWTLLKTRLANAASNKKDLIYTFGRTPSWLTSAPQDATCDYSPGECDAPTDINADGSGTDQAVQDFWTAFMNDVCTGTAPNKTCAPIKYFEMWNEPNAAQFWNGNYAELARMSSDATAIIKSQCSECIVLASDVSCGGDGGHFVIDPNTGTYDSGQCDLWMEGYLASWQKRGHMPDGGAWHPYPARTNVVPPPFPETNVSASDSKCTAANVPNKSCRYSIVDQIKVMRAVFDAHGLAGKPMVATEGSWASDSALPDADQQAAFLARWFLVQAAGGVSSAFWYAQDNSINGTLWDSTHGIHLAGTAYAEVYRWLVGNSIAACTTRGTLWSCPLASRTGYRAQVLWDTSESCSGGVCGTHAESVSGSFTRWLDLAGNTGPIAHGSVLVGMKPILVQ